MSVSSVNHSSEFSGGAKLRYKLKISGNIRIQWKTIHSTKIKITHRNWGKRDT